MLVKRFTSALAVVFLVWISSGLAGCASSANSGATLHFSDRYYNFIQPSFSQYVEQSREWLSENRTFITDDKAKELAMNLPYQLSPKGEVDKAILLVHGLGDSPYTFSDIAQDMVALGFHVEVLLLPGHGSKPEDMMLPSYQDWQYLVDHYANLLKTQYKQVWLGGFSTGGNLVTTHTIEQGGIDGLLLFSPGFKSLAGFWERFTPLVALFFDWGFRSEETNLAKYNSSTLNGALAYTRSAERVRTLLARETVNVPTLAVLSEHDSIIDPVAVKHLFDSRFIHPESQLIWFGRTPVVDQRISFKTMDLPPLRISTASHMSIVFDPHNPYYGMNGEKRICKNSFDQDQTQRCIEGAPVWYAAWGYEEQGKLHARLTWNPYYEDMLDKVAEITGGKPGALLK